MMNERQIKDKIYQLETELKILKEILKTETNIKFGRPIGSIKYPDEQVIFLQENKDMYMKDLIQEYNQKFNADLPKNSRALYNFMQRVGILSRQFTREYYPRNPSSIEKSRATKEEIYLKKVGIDADSKD